MTTGTYFRPCACFCNGRDRHVYDVFDESQLTRLLHEDQVPDENKLGRGGGGAENIC